MVTDSEALCFSIQREPPTNRTRTVPKSTVWASSWPGLLQFGNNHTNVEGKCYGGERTTQDHKYPERLFQQGKENPEALVRDPAPGFDAIHGGYTAMQCHCICACQQFRGGIHVPIHIYQRTRQSSAS